MFHTTFHELFVTVIGFLRGFLWAKEVDKEREMDGKRGKGQGNQYSWRFLIFEWIEVDLRGFRRFVK
jgi:hypothetical protein